MKTILTFAGALLFSAGVTAQETDLQKQNVPSEVNLETVVTEEQPVLAEISHLSSPLPVDSMMLELIEIDGSEFVEVKLSETTAEMSAAELYDQGESDALQLYEGHKKSGTSTLVGTSLMLPMGIISGLDQSSAKKKESFPEIKDPFLKSNPAYMKGFSDQALKMRKKAVKKNFLIGIGIQSVVAFGVGALFMNSSGNPRVGMSGL